MAIVKLSAIERRRLSAFVTCLVLAAFAWVFTTLSNPYNFTVRAVLSYKNTPQKRAFHSLQPDTVTAILQGTGWQMLSSRVNNENKVINIDLRNLETKDYVVLSTQLLQINLKKEFGQQIVAFSPDTLYFDFSNRSVKKIPVNVITAIKYLHQFGQSGNIRTNPAYITVSGPSNVLDKIKNWSTDTLKHDSTNETINTQLNLQGVKEGNISIYPKTVHVVVPIDEFTEKTIELPVKLTNNHNYYDVKVFPQKVKVTFTTSLRKYAQMDEDFFEASADLNLWRDHGYSVLPVKLTRYPSFSKIVRIQPQNIDFIIRK